MEAFVFSARLRRAVVALGTLPVLVLAACGKPDGPTRIESLEQLASEWSSGRAEHTCRHLGPISEYLGPGRDYCQWLTAVRGSMYSTVGIFRDSLVGFTLLQWERRVRDSVDLRRVVDSLHIALLAQDFITWECPNAGRHWENARFVVQLLSATAQRRDFVVLVSRNSTRIAPDPLCPAPPGVRKQARSTADRLTLRVCNNSCHSRLLSTRTSDATRQ